uniref:Zygote arrest 1 like n=1 Tax=Crocodylus porosus TaxID=8502 RepID=A0A7M4EE63_CROPO
MLRALIQSRRQGKQAGAGEQRVGSKGVGRQAKLCGAREGGRHWHRGAGCRGARGKGQTSVGTGTEHRAGKQRVGPGPAGRWLPALSVAVSRVQFLEQKYGYFHCKDCRTRWESAYVWCISGSNKVYFKQLCRKCQKGFNPYKVEAIQCQTCSKTHCSCPQKKRHIDLKRPHRQELCGRCKGKRLSCDNTYSFKYIV